MPSHARRASSSVKPLLSAGAARGCGATTLPPSPLSLVRGSEESATPFEPVEDVAAGAAVWWEAAPSSSSKASRAQARAGKSGNATSCRLCASAAETENLATKAAAHDLRISSRFCSLPTPSRTTEPAARLGILSRTPCAKRAAWSALAIRQLVVGSASATAPAALATPLIHAQSATSIWASSAPSRSLSPTIAIDVDAPAAPPVSRWKGASLLAQATRKKVAMAERTWERAPQPPPAPSRQAEVSRCTISSSEK